MNNHISAKKKHHYRELLSIGIPIIIGQLGTIVKMENHLPTRA